MNKLNYQGKQRQSHREQDDALYGWMWGLGGGGIEEKGKKIHGQQYGDWWGEGSMRGLNVDGKKYNNIHESIKKIDQAIETNETKKGYAFQ